MLNVDIIGQNLLLTGNNKLLKGYYIIVMHISDTKISREKTTCQEAVYNLHIT